MKLIIIVIIISAKQENPSQTSPAATVTIHILPRFNVTKDGSDALVNANVPLFENCGFPRVSIAPR